MKYGSATESGINNGFKPVLFLKYLFGVLERTVTKVGLQFEVRALVELIGAYSFISVFFFFLIFFLFPNFKRALS